MAKKIDGMMLKEMFSSGAALHALLQLGLIVCDVVDLPLGQTVEDVREDKALRRLQPAVEVHGGDDRLYRIGEDGRALASAAALLPVAKADIIAQMQRARHAVQCLLAHELGAQASAHRQCSHAALSASPPAYPDRAGRAVSP